MESLNNPSLSNEERNGAKRKYNPDFCDFLVKNTLASPSLTVEWLPSPEKRGGQIPKRMGKLRLKHRLVIGTCNTDKDNHLVILTILFSENRLKLKVDNRLSNPYPASCTFKVGAAIKHSGVVNRSRYMPQNPVVLATKSSNGDVYVYDVRKIFLATNKICEPDLMLKGLTPGGKGISWNPNRKGYIVSCSNNERTIRLWDINSKFNKNEIDNSLNKFNRGHSSGVNDCSWHSFHSSLFGSAGNDGNINLWDIRADSRKMPVVTGRGHTSSANCLSFNYLSDHLLATGSSDETIAIWDTRKMRSPFHQINWHKFETCQLHWSPINENFLASSGADNRILFWNLSKIGINQAAQDAVQRPPELQFTLQCDTQNVLDFSWNITEPLLMSSVSQDKIIQLWHMENNIYDCDNAKKISRQKPSKPSKASASPLLSESEKPILLSQAKKSKSYPPNLQIPTSSAAEQNLDNEVESPTLPQFIDWLEIMFSEVAAKAESAESPQTIKSEVPPTNIQSVASSSTEQNDINPSETLTTSEIILMLTDSYSSFITLTESPQSTLQPQAIKSETYPANQHSLTYSATEPNSVASLERPSTPEIVDLLDSLLPESFTLPELDLPEFERPSTPEKIELIASALAEPITNYQNSCNSKECAICLHLKNITDNTKLLSELCYAQSDLFSPKIPVTVDDLTSSQLQERLQSANIEKSNDPSLFSDDPDYPQKTPNIKESENDSLSLEDQDIPKSRDDFSGSLKVSEYSELEDFPNGLLCTENFNPPDSPLIQDNPVPPDKSK